MKQKNNLIKLFILVIFLGLFFNVAVSRAAISEKINYQGKLTDAAGVAKPNGDYDMIISLYTVDTGGTCVWTARGDCNTTPTARAVTVTNGIFSIMLGDTGAGDNALTSLNFNVPYYLGVTVESDAEMVDRKPIGAAGYAFNSSLLNGLGSATSGVSAHILATDSSGNATVSGSTYFNGTTYYVNSSGTGNLNGLTLAGDLAVNGNDITSTGALTVTPGAGTNFNVTLSGTGDFAVNTNQFYVDTSEAKIGIGNASPGVALHIGTTAPTNLGSTANSLMVSGALEVAGSAYLGPMEFPTDSGAIAWIDMPVSASATPNAAESYTAKLGGTNILTVYGQALGSGGGGIINPRVGIGITTPGYVLDVQHASSKINSKNGYLTNGADYAEYFYTKDTDLKSGEVVCVDTSKDNSVKRCKRSADTDVMGIVSTNPSVVGNGDGPERDNDPNYKIIGMIGQVPGLVSTENGSIKIGDNLTPGDDAGYMRKANAGESTVGVAMQNFDDDKGTIRILIARRNQSLTVEKVEEAVEENIANMNIQDKVDEIVSSATIELNSQIENLSSLQQSGVNLINSEISSIQEKQAKLQDQMLLIEEQSKTALDFIGILNAEDIIYRDALGNVNLSEGKISAKNIEATDKMSADNLDANSLKLGKAVSGTEKIKKGELKSDPILTKEAKAGVKVYITPKDSTEGKMLYYDEKDIEDGKSFVVKIDSSAPEKDVEFNWLIIK
ncbi:MAG TPA: hypothetical protein P5232_01365 [Candidatus Moranbacteria bacterium]|nr:hypothetical protein [Candidatus Moranbacteria bacterium]